MNNMERDDEKIPPAPLCQSGECMSLQKGRPHSVIPAGSRQTSIRQTSPDA
jgi:hypothetical protein